MQQKIITKKCISLIMMLSICLIYSLICLTKNCFSSAMVFIVEEGILTKSQTGTITGVFYLVYAILQIAGGILADKWKPAALITISLLGASAANAVIYFNHSYPVMLVVWGLNAAAQFAMWPSCFKIISSMLFPNHRAKGLIIVLLANPFGVMISYLVAALVGNLWENNFLFSSIALLVAAVYWIVLSTVARKHTALKTVEKSPEKQSLTSPEKSNFTTVFFKSGILIFVVLAFVKSSFDLGVKSLMPTIINESYTNVTPRLATILSAIALLAGVLGIYTSTFWYPKKSRTEASATATMFLLALLPCGISLLIGRINYWFIVAAMSLLVLLTSSVTPYLTTSSAARFVKWGKSGTVAGIINFAASLGISFANMTFTRIADAHGWVVTMRFWFILLSTGALLALVSIPIWARFLKKEEL